MSKNEKLIKSIMKKHYTSKDFTFKENKKSYSCRWSSVYIVIYNARFYILPDKIKVVFTVEKNYFPKDTFTDYYNFKGEKI